MHILVLLVVCLNAAVRGTCSQIPIASSDDPQDNGSVVTMSGCLGLEGMNTAIKYWDAHPDLHKNFQYGGWACRVGNKKSPDNGKA